MNDCDWFAAHSRAEAAACYLREIGMKISDDPTEDEISSFDGAELDNFHELTDSELDNTQFYEEGAFSDDSPTFRKKLATITNQNPHLFATTEH